MQKKSAPRVYSIRSVHFLTFKDCHLTLGVLVGLSLDDIFFFFLFFFKILHCLSRRVAAEIQYISAPTIQGIHSGQVYGNNFLTWDSKKNHFRSLIWTWGDTKYQKIDI